jgi:hypothetical protein
MSTHDTAYDPNLAPTLADDDWDDVPITPRARMPRITKLLVLLTVALAAFAAGIFAQRHWGAKTTSGTGGSFSPPAGFSLPSSGGAGDTGAAVRGGSRGFQTAFGGLTTGQVDYIKGRALYVTDSSGNTVKVTVPKGVTVSTSVTTGLRSVHPGDTVVVTGSTLKNGAVRARSVSIGSAGIGGAGTATGFGGGLGNAPALGTTGAPSGFGSDSGSGSGQTTNGATGFGGSGG